MLALSHRDLAALVVAVCFASGLNVYATVVTLGLLARSGALALPEPLALIESWWVIGGCAAIWLIDFFADKTPGVDLVWNVLQTFVRVPAAGLIAYAAATPLSPAAQLAAAAAGSLIALAAHGGKLAMRTTVTASPEPFSNIALSVAEDAIAIGLTWFATHHPILAGAIALIFVAAIVLLVRLVIRGIRRLFRPAGKAFTT